MANSHFAITIRVEMRFRQTLARRLVEAFAAARPSTATHSSRPNKKKGVADHLLGAAGMSGLMWTGDAPLARADEAAAISPDPALDPSPLTVFDAERGAGHCTVLAAPARVGCYMIILPPKSPAMDSDVPFICSAIHGQVQFEHRRPSKVLSGGGRGWVEDSGMAMTGLKLAQALPRCSGDFSAQARSTRRNSYDILWHWFLVVSGAPWIVFLLGFWGIALVSGRRDVGANPRYATPEADISLLCAFVSARQSDVLLGAAFSLRLPRTLSSALVSHFPLLWTSSGRAVGELERRLVLCAEWDFKSLVR
ncbi:hypothetical protein DFH09DRAFT_1068774 [Mycena vulgaris]|nr:hypothetical protein DFH09DRAFT_1068774 [Mycena vulgaris]